MKAENWSARTKAAQQEADSSSREQRKFATRTLKTITRSGRVINNNYYSMALVVILVTILMATLGVPLNNQENKLGSAWAYQAHNNHHHHHHHQQSHASTGNHQASQTQPTSTTTAPSPKLQQQHQQANQFHQIPIEPIKNVTFIEVKQATSTTLTSTTPIAGQSSTQAPATASSTPKSESVGSTSTAQTTTASSSSSHQLAGRSAALLVSSLPPPPLSSSARAFLEDALATSASTLSGSISTLPPPPRPAQATHTKVAISNKHRLGSSSSPPNQSGARSSAGTTASTMSFAATSATSTTPTPKPVKHVKKAVINPSASSASSKLRKTEAKLPVKSSTTTSSSTSITTAPTTVSKQAKTISSASELEQMSSNKSVRSVNGGGKQQQQPAAAPSIVAATSSNPTSSAAPPKLHSAQTPATSVGNLQGSSSTPAATTVALSGAASKSNPRWTHFGARLKPLSSPSNSAPKFIAQQQKPYAGVEHQASNSRTKPSVLSMPVAASTVSNQVDSSSSNSGGGPADDDDDDDQDSEAMLYNMLQQQQQQQQGPSLNNANIEQQVQLAALPIAHQLRSQQTTQQSRQQQTANQPTRVVKLMKSYSHIHQVDDSDDQPRGQARQTKASGNQVALASQQQQQLRKQHQNYYSAQGNPPSYAQPRQNQQAGRPAVAQYQQQHRNQFNRDQSNSLSDNSNQEDSGDYPDSSGPSGDYPQQPQMLRPNAYQQHQGMNPSSLHSQASGPDPRDSSGGDGGGDPNHQGGGPEEDEFECPDDGIFADEASGCQSYLVCQSGAQVQQKFQCPLGTLFNNIILTCDFAHNVQCGKGNKNNNNNGAAGPEQASDPNDTIRGPPAAPSNQYQQPSTVGNLRQQKNTPSQARPQYQQLPQPWQQHYPPSPAQQQQPAQTQPIVLNVRPRQQQQQYQAPAYQNNDGPAASTASDGNNDSDDAGDQDARDNSGSSRGSSDYDAPEPLVPASLPPSAMSRQQANNNRYQQQYHASGSSILPYKAPPAPAPAPAPAAAPQQYQQPNREFQSAHKSQLRPSNYQVDSSAANYDGASVVTPVYTEQPKSQHQSVSSSARATSTTAQSSGGSDEPSTFNLVINHVTKPIAAALPVVKLHQTTTSNNYQQQQNVIAKQVAMRNQVASDHQTPFKPMRIQLTPTVIAQHQKPIKHQQQQFVQTQPQVATSSITSRQHPRPPSIRPHSATQQQQTASSNSYQPLASQARPVHVSNNAHSDIREASRVDSSNNAQPTVIDLTSDRQIGVSSEAMNNGLLLIVRHSPSTQQQHHSSPIGSAVASSHVSTTHASPLEQFNNVVMGSRPSYNRNTENSDESVDQGISGALTPKAYAVNPAHVRPNSPIDAQLFPNVQNVLSNNQPRAIVNQHSAATHNAASSGVHAPLGHLEPPKPTLIETTSHLQYNRQRNLYDNDNSYQQSSLEPISLMPSSGSSGATGSAFETASSPSASTRSVASASGEQMATQGSWMTTTQATPPSSQQTTSSSNNINRQKQPVTSNNRLKAAKVPESSAVSASSKQNHRSK